MQNDIESSLLSNNAIYSNLNCESLYKYDCKKQQCSMTKEQYMLSQALLWLEQAIWYEVEAMFTEKKA